MRETAVLISSFNRKEKTVNCLRSLYNSFYKYSNHFNFDIFLVDDNSTDGTPQEIITHFPKVNIIKGTGNLYWAGGMRLAWEIALQKEKDYEFFLLLNDDVILNENFLTYILITHRYCISKFSQCGIYVCSTMDLESSKISYGGRLITKRGIRIRSVRITPSDIPTPCSMANGNILMVPSIVVNRIGILDPKFRHRFADFDYTLRANNYSIPVLVCPGIGGYCKYDHGEGWLSYEFSLIERIKFLYSLKGLGYCEQLYYLKKNFVFQLPYNFLMLWLKTLLPFFWDKFKKQTD